MMNHILAGMAMLCLGAAAMAADPGQQLPAGGAVPAAPTSRQTNDPFVGQGITDANLAAAQAMCNGRKIGCAVPGQTFNGTWLAAVKEADANGSVVHMTLQPNYPGCLQDINSGAKDAYFTTFAQQVGAYGKLIYLRPMQEVNLTVGEWKWSDQPPADFINAFRRIAGIFRRYAPNAKIEWNLANSNAGKHTFSEFNPGVDHYDYVGMDGYNWGTSMPWSKWQSFDEVFSPVYAYVKTLNKQVIISEYGCARDGGDKNAWIADAFNQVRISGKYNLVFMMLYFDVENKPNYFDIDSGGRTGYNQAISFPSRKQP
jgi:hypothetical protein